MALEVIIYPSQEMLGQLWAQSPQATIIVPDPPRADLWRARWGQTGATVKTINEWQRAELERCFGRERQAWTKAQIMLYLGRAWRAGWQHQWLPREIAEGLDFNWFLQAYTLLSDLRSFTLDFSLLQDFWPLHPQIADAVQFLQQCLNGGDCWDEHQVYAQLSAKYQDPQVAPPLVSTVIFWDFTHLSAMQVDYLKALATRVQVIVPYPAKAWQNSLPSDWIRWLTPLGPEEIKTQFTLPAQGTYHLATFPGGRLAETLGKLNLPPATDLYLLTQDLAWPVQEVAQAAVAAKIKIDLWQPIIEQIWQELQQYRQQQGSFNQRLQDKELAPAQFTQFLKQLGSKIQQQAAQGDLAAGRWFKVWSLLQHLAEEWQALSDQSWTIAGLELALWRKVLYQRVPRVYGLSTAAQEATAVRAYDLAALPFYDRQKFKVVIAASSFGPWRPLGERYREEELRILNTLGPIYREDVAYQAQLQSLGELLQGSTLLLVEENLLTQELGLHEIISQMPPRLQGNMPRITEASPELKIKREAPASLAAAATFWPTQLAALAQHPLPRLSASNLQKFVDCPRQYALTYLGDYNFNPRPQQAPEVLELGTMAHAILAAWGQSSPEVSLDALIEQQLAKASFTLPYDRWKTFEELYSVLTPVIQELHKLEEQAPRSTWRFEYDLAYRFDPQQGSQEKTDVCGKIDLIIPHPLGLLLFDFKWSQKISEKAVQEFKKIQLWFYINHGIKPQDLAAWGFINLKDLPESMIMAVTPAAHTYLDGLEFLQTNIKLKDHATFLTEDLPRYQAQEASWIQQMQNHEFGRRPQGEMCKWCAWANVCGA